MEDEFFNVRFRQNKVQKKTNAKKNVLNYERNEMEKNLQTLHIQRKIWKGHIRNAICWDFYCANDDKEGDPRNPQVMRCQFCYNSLVHAFNLNTQKKKKT